MTATALGAGAAALAGALCAALPACIPGLHVYNLLGALVLLLHASSLSVPAPLLVPFAAAAVTAFAVLNTLPSVLLAAPDESALFTVLPGQKMMMRGQGADAVLITSIGSAAGLLLLTAFAAAAPRLLPRLHTVIRPHTHWILWCVIAFMLMSEWPKPSPPGKAGWHRFLMAWRSTGAGILVFLLSGVLGFILLYRSPMEPGASFQNLMPAFVGLFTLPSLLINIASRVQPPPPRPLTGGATIVPAETALRGITAGALGGGFAAFIPVVTGGVGGMLAGHATALRDDRAFLISQGVSKLIYYTGGLLLLFTPGVELTRGGAAAMIGGLLPELHIPAAYPLALAGTALGGSLALLLLQPLTRLTLTLGAAGRYRRLSIAALAGVCILVATLTGTAGVAVMLVATGIGTLPILYGARRMNALGVILLPMACNMSGVGPSIAGVLGLF